MKNSFLKFIFLCLGLSSVFFAHAQRVSLDEAKKYARDYVGSDSISENLSERNTYYIFNVKGGGFCVVSSSHKSKQKVLLWSTKGEYDLEKLPKFYKDLLDGFDLRMKEYEEEERSSLKSGATTNNEEAFEKTIEPLIKTKWGQGAPYNYLLFDDKMPTGCVATAMAQIMYYHQHPQKSEDIPAYTDSYGNEKPGLTACEFKWEDMQLVYDDSADNGEEVSRLMLYCGQAVKMDYDHSGSGSNSFLASQALQEYFGYSNKIRYIQSIEFDKKVWQNTIYDELAEKRPVLFSGYNQQHYEGHAFICDGYKEGGFHFNLGYEGSYDDLYVAIDEVKFSTLLDFSYFNGAVIGIEPAKLKEVDGLQLEISDLDIHSSFCKLSPTYIDINIKNHDTDPFQGNIFLSSNILLNTTGPTMVNGVVQNGTTDLLIPPGENAQLTYLIGPLEDGEVSVKFTTDEGTKVGETEFVIGGYTNDKSVIECSLAFTDVSYYKDDKYHYLEAGWNNAKITFTNNGELPFRDVVQILYTPNHEGMDTLFSNGDYFIEIPPHSSKTFDYEFFVDYTHLTLLRVGIHKFAEAYIWNSYRLDYMTTHGQLTMEERSNKVPQEALYVDLTTFHPDTLDIEDANPNCLFFTDREGYRPFGVEKNLIVNGHTDYLTISGGTDFLTDSSFIADTAEFTWVFSASKEIFFLPFAPEEAYLPDGTEVLKSNLMKVERIEALNNGILEFAPTDEILPLTPYLFTTTLCDTIVFRAKKATIPASTDVNIVLDDSFLNACAMVGSSLSHETAERFDYLSSYKFNASSQEFIYAGLSEAHNPFDCYLANDLGFVESYPISSTTDTPNVPVASESTATEHFDILGRKLDKRNAKKVDNLKQGVYISNGKKFIVK